MKFSLPLKLGIFIILLFTAVITTCLLWTPVKLNYYMGKLHSSNHIERINAFDKLLEMGKEGKRSIRLGLKINEDESSFLIENWNKVNSRKPYSSLLHVPAMRNYRIAAELLINKGANVNAKDFREQTPLELAEFFNNSEMVNLFLENGATASKDDEDKSSGGGITSNPRDNPWNLDPSKKSDRAVLLEYVRNGGGPGYDNKAAKLLAKAGYIKKLEALLASSSRLNTLYAIGQTRDERLLKAFLARLKKEPDNGGVVGALGYFGNKKSTSALLEILKKNPDNKNPVRNDIVGYILHALYLIKDPSAVPVLLERFENIKFPLPVRKETGNNFSNWELARRKSRYARALVASGCMQPIGYMKEMMRNDVKIQHHVSGLHEYIEGLGIEDDSFLPIFLDGLNSPDQTIVRESIQNLRKMTRHNFGDDEQIWSCHLTEKYGEAQAQWKRWYEKQKDNHPVYSIKLEKAVEMSIVRFQKEFEAGFSVRLSNPNRGYAHTDYLWKLDFNPRYISTVFNLPKSLKYRLVFDASFTTRAEKLDTVIYSESFPRLNITIRVSCDSNDKNTIERIKKLASISCSYTTVRL